MSKDVAPILTEKKENTDAFFAAVMQRLLSGDRVALFLVLAPYLAIQCLRITLLAWRLTAKPTGG